MRLGTSPEIQADQIPKVKCTRKKWVICDSLTWRLLKINGSSFADLPEIEHYLQNPLRQWSIATDRFDFTGERRKGFVAEIFFANRRGIDGS
jgi:hypothetical protein